jgi:O-antigen/teichoic acid export membrane protein
LYAFHTVVSRRLGVAGYGALSSLLGAVLVISVLGTIATTIVARFAAEFAAVGDAPKLRRLRDVVAAWCAGLIVVGAIVSFAASGPLSDFLHLGDPRVIVFTGITTALGIAVSILRGILQGAQRFAAFAISNFADAGGRVVGGLAGVFLGYGVTGAMAGMGIGLLGALAYTCLALARAFNAPPERMRIDLRRLIATSGGVAAAIAGISTLFSFDQILVKHYLSAEEAGLYGAATLAGRAIYLVVSFLPTVVLPKATSHAASGESSTRLLAQAGGLAVAVCALSLAVCWAAPGLVVRLFAGPAFAAAAPIVLPYALALCALSIANLVATYKIGLHRFDFVGPLLAVLCAEVVAIANYHADAQAILRVLLAGHTTAMLVTLYRVTAGARRPQAAAP